MFSLSPEIVQTFLTIRLPVLILAITIHEFAHCWTDDRLGDDTPRMAGRITLNPLAHLDPMGTVMMVVSGLAGFGFGWGKPAPFNPMNFRHPDRDRMLGALAGPLSNVLQMLVWASLGLLLTPLLSLGYDSYLFQLCLFGVLINAVLAMFNLLPVYPLDGHHILSFVLPRTLRPIVDNPMWMYVFLAVVFIGPLRSNILEPYLMASVKWAFIITGKIVGWPG